MVFAIFQPGQRVGKERHVLAKDRPGLLKKVILHIAGISLILLGIIGLFLPVLQGILLIIGGLGVLSVGNEGVKKWICNVAERFPKQALYFKRIKLKLSLQQRPFRNHGNDASEKRTNDIR